MKAFLMYRDQDFDLEQPLPVNEQILTQDLELNTLFNAMAHGDPYLLDIARRAVLTSVRDPEAIAYRQQALTDCIEQSATVQRIYEIAVEAVQAERKIWGFWSKSPESVLYRSIQVMHLLVEALKRLREIAGNAAGRFQSEAFVRLFSMLTDELSDDYFQEIEAHLRELKFPGGVLISAGLGAGAKGVDYVLRRAPKQSWIERISPLGRSGLTFAIAERDESGFRALEEMRGKGINLVANALAQSSDHIVSFFRMLRAELAFYIGCLNLHARLRELGGPLCMPIALAQEIQAFSAQGLYDVCLALQRNARVVGNAVNADHKSLIIITGANQGGKSTFLRSIGVAYLMTQCGMFAPAQMLRASVCDGLFTHYKREEDPTMRSGKLDEELSRMSDIADTITAHSILLCNESFASTNEREGSEIARQVTGALIQSGVKVFLVTHLFDLAHGFYRQRLDTALFLRAERQANGRRTFQLVEGEPLPTSHGADVYTRIFHSTSHPASDPHRGT